MSHHGVGPRPSRPTPGGRAVPRSVALLTAGALAVPLLAACSSDDTAGKPLAGQDIAPAARADLADGGILRWAVDSVPQTLNTFQSDADATTSRIAQAVLPSMYRLDGNGRAERHPGFLESAKIVETEPKQVVLYKLNQQAVWSDGREIGAADFAAQWRALSGKDSAYWTARNAGYERIEKIQRGSGDLEVKVTFSRPYADWKSLFSPLYPKEVMGTPDAFNDGARRKLAVTAGPFTVNRVDRADGRVTLVRNARWWGDPARLSAIELRAVPRDRRAAALIAGTIDLADIDPATARRITAAARAKTAGAPAADPGAPLAGPGLVPAPGRHRSAADALRSWAVAHGSDEEAAERETEARRALRGAAGKRERGQHALRRYEVRKSLEPAYTQLALNGSGGPLADERVRRAVARALDREEIARAVLKPLGLPAVPVGSHLALSGQAAYADGSGALGGQDTKEAQALLADAGWERGGPVKKQKGEKAAGAEGGKTGKDAKKDAGQDSGDDDGTYIVGGGGSGDGKADRDRPPHGTTDEERSRDSASGAYAPKGTAAPAAAGRLAKGGKALTLRFVLPSGPGTESLRRVADRIVRMLDRVGIRTTVTKVPDASYFKDHIASGEYDLALYSWPASAFPATDARPIFAKPVPAADGSLSVEQNYTRVGTDQVDQLFDQAAATLDEDEARSLIRKADSRIWAAAGSIPLYQRPQLTAARKDLANAGAFGFETPVYEDMGFLKNDR
ncbi:ABC transporter family substrate-binding protein [Streptomyces sp. NPDC051207]|uniref:ABC transporter family substrate-binding protein n=1 Tax=Streptomyces sp. NPDC051207 TaxID=3154641 RepID=UPI00341C3BD5